MARRRRRGVEEVIAHHVDPVEIHVELVHFGVIEIFAIRGCDGQRIPAAAGAALSGTCNVQLVSQHLEQPGEILPVFGAIFDAGNTLARIFPIDIDSVRGELAKQLDGTVREQGRGSMGGRGFWTPPPHPPSNGTDNFEPWIRLLQREETQEIRFEFAIGERPLTRRSDLRKRKIYVRELIGMYHRRSGPTRDVGHDSIPVSRRRSFSDLRSKNSSCKAPRANENAKKKRKTIKKQSCKIPRLQDSLRARRCGKLSEI